LLLAEAGGREGENKTQTSFLTHLFDIIFYSIVFFPKEKNHFDFLYVSHSAAVEF
jgi:hypothetical protein